MNEALENALWQEAAGMDVEELNLLRVELNATLDALTQLLMEDA